MSNLPPLTPPEYAEALAIAHRHIDLYDRRRKKGWQPFGLLPSNPEYQENVPHQVFRALLQARAHIQELEKAIGMAIHAIQSARSHRTQNGKQDLAEVIELLTNALSTPTVGAKHG